MNIRTQLLKEHSRANADRIGNYVLSSPNAIIELMVCFLGDEERVAQRAAQVVGNIGRSHPKLLLPWLSELVDASQSPIHDAVRRNATRYFSELELSIPKHLEKRLIRLYTDWTCDPEVPVAIAVFGMQFVADRCAKFPAEARQIKEQIKERLLSGTASAGFRNRGEKILRQLS